MAKGKGTQAELPLVELIPFQVEDIEVLITESRDHIRNGRERHSYISMSYPPVGIDEDQLLTAEAIIDELYYRAQEAFDAKDELLYTDLYAKAGAMRAEMMRKLTRALECGFPGYKLKWSREAGCSCGCSRGWVMTNAETGKVEKGTIHFVTVTVPVKQPVTQPA